MSVRFSREEAEAIWNFVEFSGLSLSDLMRSAILTAVGKKADKPNGQSHPSALVNSEILLRWFRADLVAHEDADAVAAFDQLTAEVQAELGGSDGN